MWMPGLCFLCNASGAVVVVSPIAAGQIRVGYGGAGVRGMNKLAITRIDAHMGNAGSICTCKKYDITNLEIGFCYISAPPVLIRGSTVGRKTELL